MVLGAETPPRAPLTAPRVLVGCSVPDSLVPPANGPQRPDPVGSGALEHLERIDLGGQPGRQIGRDQRGHHQQASRAEER